MKLSEIFNTPTDILNDEEKVKAISDVVKKARTAYGNSEVEISAPEVMTVDGIQDLALLCAKSKVAIAEMTINGIRTFAVEFGKETEGAVLDKKIEEMIATNAILANITAKVDSEYL